MSHTLNLLKIEMERNFKIIRADTSLPYDYGSIMHYPADAFSSNGQPTIRTRQPASIGQRKELSTIDWRHLQRGYCQHHNKIWSKEFVLSIFNIE